MVSESGLINDPNPEVCMINKVNFYMIITKVNTKKNSTGYQTYKTRQMDNDKFSRLYSVQSDFRGHSASGSL